MTVCFCAGRVEGRYCYGGLTSHHVIPRQRIKAVWRSLMAEERRGGEKPWAITKALADPRNRVWVCFGCHLGLVETSTVRVENGDLPEGFWEFVEEYKLWGELPRHLTGQETVG